MENVDLLPDGSPALVDTLLIAFGLGLGLAYWLRGRVLRKMQRVNDEMLRAVTRLESLIKSQPLPDKRDRPRREISAKPGLPGYPRADAPSWGSAPENTFLKKEISPALAARQLAVLLDTSIFPVPLQRRDDLKQISGIGPRTEEKLHLLGIYTFQQVSQLNDHAIRLLTAAIHFYPDRVQQEDWVGQAQRLMIAKKKAPLPRKGEPPGKNSCEIS